MRKSTGARSRRRRTSHRHAGADEQSSVRALSLDDFVKFTGGNAPESWIERAWNPVTSSSGTLGNVWFDYDIYRAGALTQCGSNSVQLQKSDGAWKIVSMAFSSRTTDCPSHPAPTE